MTQRRRGYTYEFPRKQMMVDAVVGGVTAEQSFFGQWEAVIKRASLTGLHILLIRRDEPPYKGWWALPGGHNEENESFEQAVVRELKEETNVNVCLVQFHTFSDPGRDPREDTGTVAYFGLVRTGDVELQAGSDAKEARWFPVNELPAKLAFDHKKILTLGLEQLREALWKTPVLLKSVLPEKFSIGHLHAVYEQVLGESVNKANFRRDYLKLGFLEELKEVQTKVANRPPRLYRFKPNLKPV